MCLLVQASRSLLSCDSIEEIMDTIKTGKYLLNNWINKIVLYFICLELPGLPKSSLEDVIKQAACLNVSKQLKTYEVLQITNYKSNYILKVDLLCNPEVEL